MNATDLAVTTQAEQTSVGGGILAGRFFIGPLPYALIVAPKAEGDHGDIKWSKSLKRVEGATSFNDGLANTEAMLLSGSPLAKWARELRIDGHDDWYIPSRLELLLAFGELKGTPAFDFDLDWYWSSTQHASAPEYAWTQSFGYGNQNYDHKSFAGRARAVRRTPIR